MKRNFFASLKDKQTVIEILKSIAVGLFSNAIDFLLTALFLYAFCHEHYNGFWGVFTGATIDGLPYDPPSSSYIIATAIGFIAAVVVNYILSSIFVFKHGNVGKTKFGFIKFAVFSAVGLGLTSLFNWIGYDVLGCNPWLTKLVVQFIIFFYNFITRRLFIFNAELIRDDEHTIKL